MKEKYYIKFHEYLKDVVKHFQETGSMRHFSDLSRKHKCTKITIPLFYEYCLHQVEGEPSRKLSDTIRDRILEEGRKRRGADLRDADLRGADLSGADLRGADLSGAYLRGELGKLESTSDILIVGPIGSRNGYTTIYHTNKGLFVQCGCFRGTIDEFSEKVKETHGDSKHARDYQLLIDFAKKKYEATTLHQEQ